jgi:hypothetical protein
MNDDKYCELFKIYQRSDRAIAEACQFKGAEGELEYEDTLLLIDFLNENNMNVKLVSERSTDEWEETDEGEIVEIIDPEHLRIQPDRENEENFDRANVGDYIVKRDGAFYVMQEELFESIWEMVRQLG